MRCGPALRARSPRCRRAPEQPRELRLRIRVILFSLLHLLTTERGTMQTAHGNAETWSVLLGTPDALAG